MEVSRRFKGCFKEVLRVFQGSFNPFGYGGGGLLSPPLRKTLNALNLAK